MTKGAPHVKGIGQTIKIWVLIESLEETKTTLHI